MRLKPANGVCLPLLLCSVWGLIAWFPWSRDTFFAVLSLPINPIAHYLLGFGLLNLLVRDTGLLLLLLYFRGDVEAVVRTQVEEVDVLLRVYTCCFDTSVD